MSARFVAAMVLVIVISIFVGAVTVQTCGWDALLLGKSAPMAPFLGLCEN